MNSKYFIYYFYVVVVDNTGVVSVQYSYLPCWWSQGPDHITQDARYLFHIFRKLCTLFSHIFCFFE